MRVSIVIPCYNAEPYLAEALGSAIEQTSPPREVIVVDDGSTDGSVALARRVAADHAGRVRVIEGPSGGAAAARNRGAAIATGEALLFLDADDVLGAEAVQSLTAALSTRPGAVAICPWHRLEFTGEGWQQAPPSCAPRRPDDDALAAWLRGWYHPPCSVLWSRDAFERTGRWDEHCTQNDDGDLMMRALALGVPLVETPVGAAYYRRPPEGGASLSGGRFGRDGLAARIRVIAKIAALLDSQHRLDRYRRPIAQALHQIAADATPTQPDLAASARAYARSYGAGSWRLLPPASSRGPGSGPRPSPDARDHRREAHDAPTVSVIIPTYQRAHILHRPLDSVLAQSYGDFEVLVVDDGSTDDTAAVVESYEDARVRYVRQPKNRGVSAARNRGLREARGALIAFLDSDDVWLPHKLAHQVQLFDRLPQRVGLVYGGVENDDGHGRVELRTPTARGDLYRQLLVKNVLHGGGSNVMIRRPVVATVGFFDEDIPAIEDYDYWLRVSRFYDVDFVAEPVMRYHDPHWVVRRSLDRESNLAAREWFYGRHGREMRRIGVAHHFLLESAKRQLAAGHRGDRAARQLAWRAVARRPTSGAAWNLALRLTVPHSVRALRRRRRAARAGHEHGELRVVLYSSTSPVEPGGVQAVYRDLAAHLRREGHTVFETWSDAGDSDADGVHPVRVPATWAGSVPVPRTVLASFLSGFRLARALRRYRPDVVNIHFLYPPDVIVFLALRPLFRYQLVLSAHGSDVLKPIGPKVRFLPRLLRRADAVTAVSPVIADRVIHWAGVDTAKVHTVPNTVDCGYWAARPRSAGSPTTASRTVLAVGRLTPVKGFDVLLEAFGIVRHAVPEARLVVVGDGPAREDLATLSCRSGVDGAVRFTGHLSADQIRDHMSEASVFVLPSRSEGMPLSLLEAMAAGRPPVATAVGGVPTMLSGGAGVLVPPSDAAALAESIVEVLTDRALAEELGRRARRRAVELCRGGGVAAYERLFRSLAHGTVDAPDPRAGAMTR